MPHTTSGSSTKPITPPNATPLMARWKEISRGVWKWLKVLRMLACPTTPPSSSRYEKYGGKRFERPRIAAGCPAISLKRGRMMLSCSRARTFASVALTPTAGVLPRRSTISAIAARPTMMIARSPSFMGVL